MSDTPEKFQHRLSRAALRDEQGLLLVESTCSKCGASKTVSIGNGWLQKWESSHICGKGIPFRPKAT
jgi:hypothetical protein